MMPANTRRKSSTTTLEANNNNNNNNNNNDENRKLSSTSSTKQRRVSKDHHHQSGQSSLSSTNSNNDNNSDNSSSQQQRLLSSSNADYDHIRNTTLMFFLDRLYIASKDGQEARTLHDLSCLFGTRDFTKEMRQIVGASRNGLKKFLESYPSLFTIDGDKVYLSQLKQDSTSSSARDYQREAVDYFTEKLLQFGTSLVPIRNLFGYRSQASQEVRHVSGKNTKEFKQFLLAHEDVFEILSDEHVVLKSALKEMKASGKSFTSLQEIKTQLVNDEIIMDPYLNKQFAHLIEDCMKKMLQEEEESKEEKKRITIAYLHERIIQDCKNELFLKMVKTIEDLKVFLRMHPKLFKRYSSDEAAGSGGDTSSASNEYVRLLTEEERLELEAQAFPSITRQHSTLKRCDTNESNLSDHSSINGQPISLPPVSFHQNSSQNRNRQQQQTAIKEQLKSSSDQAKRAATVDDTDARSVCSTTSSHNNSLNGGSSSLRATAPPFVPSTTNVVNRNSSRQDPRQMKQQVARQNSFNANRLSFSSSQPASLPPTINQSNQHQHHQQHQAAPLRDATNFTQRPQVNQQQQQQQHSVIQRSYSGRIQRDNNNKKYLPVSVQNSNCADSIGGNGSGGGDDLRTRTVNIVREASNIISKILASADAVAFDCKGYNLGYNGQITLIQLAFIPKQNPVSSSRSLLDNSVYNSNNKSSVNNNNNEKQQRPQKPEVCIFDLITNPELAYCLKPLLESDKIVKIVHDVRNKSNALFVQFEIMLNHIFDTQVANLVIQQQETGKPAYKSRYISMSKLCEIYGNESLIKYRNLIQSKTRHFGNLSTSSKSKDVNYWRHRPLTPAMVHESTMDVYCLINGVYQNLKSKIKPEYEPLFEQLNLEGVLARIKPDEIRSVKKERKIDLEVIDLKRKLYSDSTSAIVLSNREIRLLRHIDLTEEVRRKIQQCKKVTKKLERLDMKAAQLQSMNSQVSSDGGDQSFDPHTSVRTNDSNSTSSSSTSSSLSSSRQQTNGGGGDDNGDVRMDSTDLQRDQDQVDQVMSANLMNSSMFDELKDKMIESSSLLESLEEDDDDQQIASSLTAAATKSHNHHLEHSGSHDSCCGCNCHRISVDGNSSAVVVAPEITPPKQQQQSTPTASNDDEPAAKSSSISDDIQTTTTTQNDNDSIDSKSAVDMAVQCDLLG